MATSFTGSLRLAQMVTGDPAVKNNWGNVWDATVAAVESAITGNSAINLTGVSSYTLAVANNAADEARRQLYNFTGTPLSNVTVTLPSVPKIGWATCGVAGGFSVTLKTAAAGSTVVIPNGATVWFNCDGTNVVQLQTRWLNPQFTGTPGVDGPAGTNRLFNFTSNNTIRWQAGVSAKAETGGNIGSDFEILRYTDAGALIDSALSIDRFGGTLFTKAIQAALPITAPAGTTGTQVLNFGQFSPTVAQNGAIFLPGALLFQWGTQAVTLVNDGVGNAVATVPFSFHFSSQCFIVVAWNGDGAASNAYFNARFAPTTQTFGIIAPAPGGVIGNTVRVNYMAIGV